MQEPSLGTTKSAIYLRISPIVPSHDTMYIVHIATEWVNKLHILHSGYTIEVTDPWSGDAHHQSIAIVQE